MSTVFTVCAVFGSVIMVLQILMAVVGLDGDSEAIAEVGDDLEMGDEYVDTHQLSSQFFGILSFRSIVAALAFFGIGGHIGIAGGFPTLITIGIASAMGVTAMVAVGWMMQMLYKLKSDGTVNINNAIGTRGVVYLTVPARNQGVGKVTVSIQNRTMEYAAITKGDSPIATGSRVEICEIVDVNTIEVKPETN